MEGSTRRVYGYLGTTVGKSSPLRVGCDAHWWVCGHLFVEGGLGYGRGGCMVNRPSQQERREPGKFSGQWERPYSSAIIGRAR